MARLTGGALEQNLKDHRSLESRLVPKLKYEQAFFRERTHILRRANEDWPAYKILLQLAVEHADNSPLTRGAEAWLAAGHCDWKWIRRIQRVDEVGIDPCIAVMEGHTDIVRGAFERPDGTLVSWSGDNTLRIWSKEGEPLKVLEGHTGWVNGVFERPDGTLVSWSRDNTLRIWSNEGEPLRVITKGSAEYDHFWQKTPDEYFPARAGLLKIGNHRLVAKGRACRLRRFDGEALLEQIVWQPSSTSSASWGLWPNGRMVVTQGGGQVCFLQLYRGNQSISLEEST